MVRKIEESKVDFYVLNLIVGYPSLEFRAGDTIVVVIEVVHMDGIQS